MIKIKKIFLVVLPFIIVVAILRISFAEATEEASSPAVAVQQKETTSAVEQKEDMPSVKKEASKRTQVTGNILAIDAAGKLLTVKGRKGDVALSIEDKTTIKEGKDPKVFSDLKTGDKVTVKYVESDGKKIAKSVKIKADSKKSRSKKGNSEE